MNYLSGEEEFLNEKYLNEIEPATSKPQRKKRKHIARETVNIFLNLLDQEKSQK